MELVVGATGFLGKRIALRMREKGRHVRAMARGGSRHAKAKELVDAGIEVRDADLAQPQTLGGACAGIETVICTASGVHQGGGDAIRRIDHDGVLALIEQAEKSGVKKFVYTSYSGNIREDSPLHTAKRACEDRLLAGPMTAVILRPTYFMEVWLSPALGFDPANATARIYGSGEGRISYISAFDVAEFALATALGTEQGKMTLEMGGPEALSQLDVVGIFESALGKELKLDHVPIDAIRAQHTSADPLQKTFAALMLTYAQGDVIAESRSNAERFGIQLRSVEDHARSFQ
jgi:uncharacterized protein YbjT (DUF2867 family)